MARVFVKYLLIALVCVALIFGAVVAVNVWFLREIVTGVAGAVERGLEGQLVRERISITEAIPADSDGYALVLEDIVTGQGPRLLRDKAAISAVAPHLWYEVTRIKGGLFPAARSVNRPQTDVATLLKDGVAVQRFTCPTEDCGAWFSAGDQNGAELSGFAALRDAATPPGVAVQHMTGYYDNYDAYQAAHAAIAADPDRWFAEPGAEVLEFRGDGMGEIRVSLPVELLPYAVTAASREVEEASEARLKALGESWLGDVEGSVWVMRAWPADIYIEWQPFFGDEARPRILPGISYRQSEITITLPPEAQAGVAARIDLTGFAPPDPLLLEDALHKALADAGYDTACLPDCARVETQRIKHAADVYVRPAPSWEIESWRLMPAQP